MHRHARLGSLRQETLPSWLWPYAIPRRCRRALGSARSWRRGSIGLLKLNRPRTRALATPASVGQRRHPRHCPDDGARITAVPTPLSRGLHRGAPRAACTDRPRALPHHARPDHRRRRGAPARASPDHRAGQRHPPPDDRATGGTRGGKRDRPRRVHARRSPRPRWRHARVARSHERRRPPRHTRLDRGSPPGRAVGPNDTSRCWRCAPHR